jgi:hypothetical protein
MLPAHNAEMDMAPQPEVPLEDKVAKEQEIDYGQALLEAAINPLMVCEGDDALTFRMIYQWWEKRKFLPTAGGVVCPEFCPDCVRQHLSRAHDASTQTTEDTRWVEWSPPEDKVVDGGNEPAYCDRRSHCGWEKWGNTDLWVWWCWCPRPSTYSSDSD